MSKEKKRAPGAVTAIKNSILLVLLAMVLVPGFSAAGTPYQPDKVVYDVSTGHAKDLDHILDRVNMLQGVYDNDPFDSSIIIVLHEGAIPLFAKSSKLYRSELAERARSLTLGEIIQFRLCTASAKMQGFSQKDFHDFITMVPMADAEIIQLQRQGFAYLR